jgi:hypothetical protein
MELRTLFASGIVASLAFAAVVHAEQPVTRKGPPILHYLPRNDFTATEAGTGVQVSTRIQYNQQGPSILQKFDLTATGLAPEAEYSLFSILGDDTNSVEVTTFTSDSKGRADLSYSMKSSGSKVSKNGSGIPVGLAPLYKIQALGIAQNHTQTLAYVWIDTSTTWNYLVKRNLTDVDLEGEPRGSISIEANENHVNFRLLAGGLSPDHEYQLALNSTILATATTDENGRLKITDWPEGASAMLDLRLLQLLDGGKYAVLSTIFPK